MWTVWIAIIICVLTALILAFYSSRPPKKPDA